jgi:two-component system KDP operon response regulator KdpE
MHSLDARDNASIRSSTQQMSGPISDMTSENVDQLGIDLDDLPSSADRGRVLIIDDDPDMVQLLKQTVRSAGMDVTGALNASDALAKCIRHPPDVLLLDLMMPEVDGWETLNRLRKYTDAPVVIVSAKASKEEVVEGLESGADDYITKPFYPPELVSRVKAVMRRSGASHQQTVLNFPEIQLSLDMSARQVEIRGHAIDLSAKEFNVLSILAQNAPKPVRYEIIAVEVWGSYQLKMRNRIKWLVHNLRRKLEEEISEHELIKNRVGFGYQLNIHANHEESATTAYNS